MIKLIAGSRNKPPELVGNLVKELLNYSIIYGFDIHGFETPETRADLFRRRLNQCEQRARKLKPMGEKWMD